MPLIVLKIIAFGGDLLKLLGVSSPPLTTFRLNNILSPMVHDSSLLQAVVGELPFNYQEGIDRTLEWIYSNGNER